MSVMSGGMAWCRAATGPRRSTLLLIVAVLLGLLSRGVVTEKSKKYQMSDVCKKNYIRDIYRKIEGAVLVSQNEKDHDCTITFQTHSILQRFMLRFDQLQLDCNDHLYIYDGAHAVSSYKEILPSILHFAVLLGTRRQLGYKRCDVTIGTIMSLCYLSMMVTRGSSCSFVRECVLLTLLVTFCVAREICDKSKCQGPIKYYWSLDCTPVYKNPGDCCPQSYDCSHLNKLSKDKCYVNGHEYSINETLREEDANACDIECRCMNSDSDNGDAVFICAGTDCAFPGEQPNCFFRHTPNSCCGGTQVCLKEGEERATCEVDGKIYKDGEYFEPKSDPELDCYCMPGYKGENVEPFCKRPKHRYCSPLFRNPGSVLKQCAPVFYDGQNSRTDCSYATRCPNANDTIIHKHDNTKAIETDEGKMCRFGDLLMHIGDELKEGTDPQSSCMKCVCELPPHPTCQKRTDRECGFLWNLSDDMVTVEPTDSITPIA